MSRKTGRRDFLKKSAAWVLAGGIFIPGKVRAAVGSWNGVAFTGWNGVAQTSWNGTGISCAGGSQAAEYFGACDPTTGANLTINSYEFFSSLAVHNNSAVSVFTCPGTGTRTIDLLSAYAKGETTGLGHILVGIYPTDLSAPICQGSAELTVAGGGAWRDFSSFTGSTSLTGGTSYVLVATTDDLDTRVGFTTDGTPANAGKIEFADYTGGLPTPLPAGSNETKIFAIRCRVAAT